MQQGIYLKFFVPESQRHGGVLAYEWLLEQARKLGLHGGSAFRALAGFGRHGRLHESHFIELAGDLPVEVGFAVAPDDAQRLLDHLAGEKFSAFWVKAAIEMGVLGEDG